MISGIRHSELLSDMLEGSKSKIPIGEKIITNDPLKNQEFLPSTAGREITHLSIEQFDAFGDVRQNKTTKRDPNTNNIEYAEREVVNDGLLKEASFDVSGILHLVKKNKEVLSISGFFSQADFGYGPTGPRGEKGFDGFDGSDGSDGPDGATGCAGTQGTDGPTGIPGEPGIDGVEGITGPIGAPGPEGTQGEIGDPGMNGREGARGAKGFDCFPVTGPTGPEGPALNMSVVIRTVEPDELTVLWGVPV